MCVSTVGKHLQCRTTPDLVTQVTNDKITYIHTCALLFILNCLIIIIEGVCSTKKLTCVPGTSVSGHVCACDLHEGGAPELIGCSLIPWRAPRNIMLSAACRSVDVDRESDFGRLPELSINSSTYCFRANHSLRKATLRCWLVTCRTNPGSSVVVIVTIVYRLASNLLEHTVFHSE